MCALCEICLAYLSILKFLPVKLGRGGWWQFCNSFRYCLFSFQVQGDKNNFFTCSCILKYCNLLNLFQGDLCVEWVDSRILKVFRNELLLQILFYYYYSNRNANGKSTETEQKLNLIKDSSINWWLLDYFS